MLAATRAAAAAINPRDQIAIVIDGRIVSSPTVRSPVTSGTVVLETGLTETEATSLASSLNGSG